MLPNAPPGDELPEASSNRPLYSHLYVQVLGAIVAGVLLGHFYPDIAVQMKPLGDAFIKLIKMIIAPVIFCTVVHGIASMSNLKAVGSAGIKALVYFEIVTTLALIIGMAVANIIRPGAGMNVDPSQLDASAVASYVTKAHAEGTVEFLLDIIPKTALSAFVDGNILQILFFALLFAFALQAMGQRGKLVLDLVDQTSHVLFGIVGIIMKAAPIGAFGAMAFTIGKYGVSALGSLAALMGTFYLTCILFIVFVLGSISWFAGFSIFKFIRYIKDELLIVLGTSSSESVLPRMISRMKRLGCDESIVGLIIPTGYAFNLDGTCIYLTMATLFLAQATNVDLSLAQQLGILGVLLLTSKGAAGVTGSGFIVLAATLAASGTINVTAMAIILGIDRFMSEARALTNLIGNGVATVVVAKMEGALDLERMHAELDRHPRPSVNQDDQGLEPSRVS
ncbi:dicarboxylate/amino acid:cation symporter [Hyphomicrobium sp.]|uniref:dicarboxylate/amino acid:cation symporter n=1 Tax=Hyphomicrobium sp. TaxID=82 RepID=UPI001DF10ED4|nr:dicarboxylate/amino acid:cation symporter [Hyphomicrobium sp.]MBY0558729.1 dicarboxylate/amino acid:cation symporter [Hyphomicrobium sp.]